MEMRRAQPYSKKFSEFQLTFPQAPLLIPDGRFSRVRLAAQLFLKDPSHTTRNSSASPHTPLDCMV